MRWMATGAAMLLLAGCNEISTGSDGPDGNEAQMVEEMAQLVNEHRQARGGPALIWLQPASDAAQGHSADMARRDYFDHVSPEGQEPWDRLEARGVGFSMMAENIAYTPRRSARETLQQWIGSRGHRENLENCGYTHHGIGLQDAYWPHVFVTPLAAGNE